MRWRDSVTQQVKSSEHTVTKNKKLVFKDARPNESRQWILIPALSHLPSPTNIIFHHQLLMTR